MCGSCGQRYMKQHLMVASRSWSSSSRVGCTRLHLLVGARARQVAAPHGGSAVTQQVRTQGTMLEAWRQQQQSQCRARWYWSLVRVGARDQGRALWWWWRQQQQQQSQGEEVAHGSGTFVAMPRPRLTDLLLT